MTGNLNMNNNKITNINSTNPKNNEVVSKKWITDHVASQSGGSVDLTPYLKRDTTNLLSGGFNMRDNYIYNLHTPNSNKDAVNKQYVDNYIDVNGNYNFNNKNIYNIQSDINDNAALLNNSTIQQNFLKRDGSNTMTGDLDVNNNKIINLANPVNNNDGVNKTYLVIRLNTKVNSSSMGNYLKKDGSVQMTGNLNMNNNTITNIANPVNDNDAVNKTYLLTEINNHTIKPSHNTKNVFQYLMNDVNEWSTEYKVRVDKIDDLNNSFHYYNKKVVF